MSGEIYDKITHKLLKQSKIYYDNFNEGFKNDIKKQAIIATVCVGYSPLKIKQINMIW